MNTVNEDAFFRWYSTVSLRGITSKSALLHEVLQQYRESGREEYVLSASETRSGSEERYPFRFENVGCCGASTMFFYF